jgi:hypothetical protein
MFLVTENQNAGSKNWQKLEEKYRNNNTWRVQYLIFNNLLNDSGDN